MMFAELPKLKQRARRLANRIKKTFGAQVAGSVVDGNSRVGGGSFPERDLPTALVAIAPTAVSETVLKKALLDTTPPLVGRIEQQAFCLDPRTLTDKEFSLVIEALQQALQAVSQ
jgi:L-seryl-tRNA(Ser) seleniumtransferase